MTQMGRSDARQMLMVVRKLWGHDSTGPSGVLDQFIDRIKRPISPPPARKAKGSASWCLDLTSVKRHRPCFEYGSSVGPLPSIVVAAGGRTRRVGRG